MGTRCTSSAVEVGKGARASGIIGRMPVSPSLGFAENVMKDARLACMDCTTG